MKNLYVVILIVFLGKSLFAQCPNTDITLTTQAQVDNFKIQYPSCKEFEHTLLVTGAGITNLNGLSNITKIWNLDTYGTSILDMSGLANLAEAEYMMIAGSRLKSLNGLSGLKKVARFSISGEALTSIAALQNLTDVLNLNIYRTALTNLNGLQNLKRLGHFEFTNNQFFTDMSVLDLVPFDKNHTGQYLFVIANPLLSDCANLFMCEAVHINTAPEGVYLGSNAPGCNTIRQITNACERKALPVTLVSFEVKPGDNKTASISWLTSNETGSKLFEIQRSVNGTGWTIIGSLHAGGESEQMVQYFFTDKSPAAGSNLYRLKMIDQDQSFTYSKIKSFFAEGSSTSSVFPNPTGDKIYLSTQDLAATKSIDIFDARGIKIYSANDNLSNEIDVTHFASGLFIVNIIKTDGVVVTKKGMKR